MVNAANGNLVLTDKDISIKGRGFNIEFIRTYNSFFPESGVVNWYPLGARWTHNYHIFLSEDSKTKDVTLYEGDGSSHVYPFSLPDIFNYTTPAGKHGRLTMNIDKSYVLRYLDGSIYNFNSTGRLQNITDKNDNKLTFTYTSGDLTKVEDDSGIYLNLSYSGGLIANITDPQGRKISYNYTNNWLGNATDAMGNSTMYTYNVNNLLGSVVNRVDARLNFTYELNITLNKYFVKDIYNSIWNDTSGTCSESSSMYHFTYYNYVMGPLADPLNDIYCRTNITDSRGYTTSVYMNDYGNPLNITDPTGNTTYTKWDSDFNKISYTDANNNIYTYSYDNYTENDSPKTWGLRNRTTDPNGKSTENEYEIKDSANEFIAVLTGFTNKRGYKTSYDHDNNYNINSTIDARNNASKMTYDSYGNMISYEDFRGFTTTYSYDTNGNLLNITDPGGNVTRNTYDSLGRLKNVTDARGYVTTYEYDDNDRIVKITDALGNSTTYIYDEGSEGTYTTGIYGGCGGAPSIGGHTPIGVIDKNGLQTNYTLNHTIKRIEKIEESPGCGCSEKNFKYDENGNLIEFEDANGNKTTYEYDSLNRLTKVTDARGNYTTFTYDVNSNLLTETNRRGYTTTYEYDNLSRKTKETDATGNSTEYSFDEEGNLKTVKNARGYTTTYYYDELNRLIQIKDATNNNTYYTYDENGNRKTERDPNDNTITYYYDANSRLIKVKDALNHETTYDYDKNGNKVNETDANGNKTKYAYDSLNRVTSVTDANNNVTYYTYDATGRLLNITDANNHKTKQEYDSLGKLDKIIYPSGNQTEYDYDNVGNRIEREDAKGLSTYYTYDGLNRLVEVKYPDNSTIVYEYNQEGNPTKVINNAGFGETTYYIYDILDRVISVRVDYGAFDKYTNYTYDEVGNRKTMIDLEGNITSYIYDAIDRLINITAPGHNPILFQYDNNSRRTRLDYPNGAYTIYSYDNADRITTIWHKKSGGATIAKYTYTYDNVRNILNFTENDVNYTIYTYDNVYRLTNVSYPDGNWTAYTYDGVGNRLTMKNSAVTITYTYDVDNRILTTGNINYTHDKNGNLINKTDRSDTTLYEYDYDNRLTKVTLPDSSNVIYQYSAYGERLNKTNSSGITLYLYDGYNLLMELNHNGGKNAFFIYGSHIDEPICMVRSGASYYYHADYLGSIRVMADDNENVITTYQYDAFGSIRQETGSVNNPYRFTGREWDVESGLYYYRARYYNAILGRFLQKDPEGKKDKPNLYPYVENNPINNIDPTGKFIFTEYSGKYSCCKKGVKIWGRYLWCEKWGIKIEETFFDEDEWWSCIGTSFAGDINAANACIAGLFICIFVCAGFFTCIPCLLAYCGIALVMAAWCAASSIYTKKRCI